MPAPPAIALLSNDLMFSSTVGGAAAASGAKLHVATSPTDVANLAASHSLSLVIIDLATPGADAAAVRAQLQSASPAPAIIAYGPHVHAEKLAAAREAGCDEVFTRGQFHSQMREVIARYVQP